MGEPGRPGPLALMTMDHLKTFINYDLGATLERCARLACVVLVFIYVAGHTLGAFIHRLNDRLAGIPAPAPVRLLPPAPPALTVANLRSIARQRAIRSAGGRPIHSATRAALLEALGTELA